MSDIDTKNPTDTTQATSPSSTSQEKGEEILSIMRKGADFTHDLLKENERLRKTIIELEHEGEVYKKASAEIGHGNDTEALKKELMAMEEEKKKILEKYNRAEAENVDFANKYVEIEHENNVLANLYIASYQLHSTLEVDEVFRVILEIIINLVGAEQFGLMLLDEKKNQLQMVAVEGMDLNTVPLIKFNEGVIGEAAKSGEDYYRPDLSQQPTLNPLDPMVCIPMKIKERVIGVLVIYKLLQQKEDFTNLDYELFNMLAGHSATAIFSSKLYSESERKLTTIQGFIDILTKPEPQE